MMIWDKHTNFSSEFLTQHHDLVLRDVFHRVIADVLYPYYCSCKGQCPCITHRSQIVLSLNVNFHNQESRKESNPHTLMVIKNFLDIPEDHFFREIHNDAYPLWLIEKEFRKRQEENHFKMVSQLVWILLRLAKTYEHSILKEPRASLNEGLDLLLGGNPLKARSLQSKEHLGGEKAYGKRLNEYKSVCHFIAAFEHMKLSVLSFSDSFQIEEFLSIAHWIREKLLMIKTPNVKGNAFFTKNDLLALPSWVGSDNVEIILEPFQDKIDALNVQLHSAEKRLREG